MNQTLSSAVENRLADWAEWFAKGGASNLGFPSETYLHRLRRDGILLKRTGRAPEPHNYEAEQMEMWLCQLYAMQSELAIAICEKYLASFRTPMITIARKLKISITALERRISKAKIFLAAKLLDEVKEFRRAA